MLTRTIEYINYNGAPDKETFFFHMSKPELTEMELSVEGGMSDWLKKIVETEDASEMLSIMKKFILSSVGLKSEDGRRFEKSDEISRDFASSPAYEVLFSEITTDAEKAVQFVKGIMPAEFEEVIEKSAAEVSAPPQVHSVEV